MARSFIITALHCLMICALAACEAETSGRGLPSTIEGRVSLGPIMPVCQVGVACDGVYVAAKVVVRNGQGTIIARSTASGEGKFKIEVPAGTYVVSVEVDGPLPSCTTASVSVAAGATARGDIDCDSGIR